MRLTLTTLRGIGRSFGLLFIFCALFFQNEPIRAAGFELLDKYCAQVKPAVDRIKKCMALLASGKLDEDSKDVPYLHIAFAYFELHDFDHAIEYSKLYAEGRRNYYRHYDVSARCRNMHGMSLEICVKSPPAQVSYAYEWVGRYEQSKSLTLSIANDYDSSIRFAKLAINHFTSAIIFDHDNHSAYAERAELLAKFCKEDEARADYSIAISTALRRGQVREAQEYRDKIGSSSSACNEEFRGHY